MRLVPWPKLVPLALFLAGCIGDGTAWAPCSTDLDCWTCARCTGTTFVPGLTTCEAEPGWRAPTCGPRGQGEFGAACLQNEDCGGGLACLRCAPGCAECVEGMGLCSFVSTPFCAAGVVRCNGDFVETCNTCATAFVAAPEPCAFGCVDGACREPPPATP